MKKTDYIRNRPLEQMIEDQNQLKKDEIRENCEVHPELRVCYLGEDCEEISCPQCFFEIHQEHKLKMLKDKIGESKDLLLKTLEKIEKKKELLL